MTDINSLLDTCAVKADKQQGAFIIRHGDATYVTVFFDLGFVVGFETQSVSLPTRMRWLLVPPQDTKEAKNKVCYELLVEIIRKIPETGISMSWVANKRLSFTSCSYEVPPVTPAILAADIQAQEDMLDKVIADCGASEEMLLASTMSLTGKGQELVSSSELIAGQIETDSEYLIISGVSNGAVQLGDACVNSGGMSIPNILQAALNLCQFGLIEIWSQAGTQITPRAEQPPTPPPPPARFEEVQQVPEQQTGVVNMNPINELESAIARVKSLIKTLEDEEHELDTQRESLEKQISDLRTQQEVLDQKRSEKRKERQELVSKIRSLSL